MNAAERPTVAAIDDRPDGFLRLASCAHCGSRHRTLVEVGNDVRGGCLHCGAELSGPLEIEVVNRVTIVGSRRARIAVD